MYTFPEFMEKHFPGQQQGTYTVSYRCANCGVVHSRHIQKGTAAPDTSACRNCGCATAEKDLCVNYALMRLEHLGKIRLGDHGATRSIAVVGATWTPPD